MQTILENISITTNIEIPQEEVQSYLERAKDKYKGKNITAIDIVIDGENADIRYKFSAVPFERTRRITGYLVGTIDRWNNAKRAEERDRVKHML